MSVLAAPTCPQPFQHDKITFNDLPSELLLEIIPKVSFSPEALASLSRTNRQLHHLIKHHEASLTRSIKAHQYASSSSGYFPDLKLQNYEDLAVLHSRTANLVSLNSQWLHIVSHGPDLSWLNGRWEAIHRAGLLLLYRLYDRKSYQKKVELLHELPATSLACLLFKLVASVKILRVLGPDPIRGTFAAGDLLARSDIELALEEMLLQHGPEFFLALLRESHDTTLDTDDRETTNKECQQKSQRRESRSGKTAWAIQTLSLEVLNMTARQLPGPDGRPQPATLISCLRRAFAFRCGGSLVDNVSRMWELLSSSAWDRVDDAMIVEVVAGVEITAAVKKTES